jgi:hypothetical protein
MLAEFSNNFSFPFDAIEKETNTYGSLDIDFLSFESSAAPSTAAKGMVVTSTPWNEAQTHYSSDCSFSADLVSLDESDMLNFFPVTTTSAGLAEGTKITDWFTKRSGRVFSHPDGI